MCCAPARQGFIPGQQHLHGETYGNSAGPSLRDRANLNNDGKYLTKSDLRCVRAQRRPEAGGSDS
eukprot:SAG22_NODE_105_length_20045_cov_23.373308_1_plen_65_part_00